MATAIPMPHDISLPNDTSDSQSALPTMPDELNQGQCLNKFFRFLNPRTYGSQLSSDDEPLTGSPSDLPNKDEDILIDFDYESAYEELGNLRGIYATLQGRIQSRQFWLNWGENSAKWLIHRLRQEFHPEVRIAVSETLSEMGAVAIEPILKELEENLVDSDKTPLLEALAWVKATNKGRQIRKRIAAQVKRYLESCDHECQEAAVHLTRALPKNEAETILKQALPGASDDLSQEIYDALDELA